MSKPTRTWTYSLHLQVLVEHLPTGNNTQEGHTISCSALGSVGCFVVQPPLFGSTVLSSKRAKVFLIYTLMIVCL